MKDIEILNFIFEILYKKGSTDNFKIEVYDNFNIELSSDDIFRFYKLLLSTGFVSELNYSCGPHRAVKLNDQGYQMILNNGSYIDFVDSLKTDKEHKNAENKLEKQGKTLDIKNKEWSYKTRYIILIGGTIG